MLLDTPSPVAPRCQIHHRADRCTAAAVTTVAKSGSTRTTRLHVCAAHLATYSPANGWRREAAELQWIPVLREVA